MITIEEAIKILSVSLGDWGTEMVSLGNSAARITAAPILSDIDMPPFPKSAMDGYACRRSDLSIPLSVNETVAAGQVAEFPIKSGTCSKIMTGAAVPEGADCVFMVEDSIEHSDGTVSCSNPNTKSNICFKGEDMKTGEIAIGEGTLLKAQHMPILASVGAVDIKVKSLPKVGVIATGSELVEPGIKPNDAKIRNSNSSQIIGQLAQLGINASYYGICSDEPEKTASAIEKVSNENDIIILTGGVSAGEFDLVPDILNQLHFDLIIADMGIQPGKPVKVAQKHGKICFALSGNPVSSFIQFELLVKYYILKSLSESYEPTRIRYKLGFDYSRKKAKRYAFIPVHIHEDGSLQQIPFNGSAHIQSFAYAHGVMEIPKGISELNKGEEVYVRPI